MDFKKKTIIWEDNNEPPKNYIWVKSDGNAYEFNHTTRQWEKIMSSNGGSDESGGEGGEGNNNVFFSPVGIQPTHIAVQTDDTFSFVEIKDITLNADGDLGGPLIYSKEDLISIDINENDLNNLEIVSIDEMQEDNIEEKGLYGDYIDNILDENYIISFIGCDYENCSMTRIIRDGNSIPIIYKLGDNLYTFTTIEGLS